MMRWPRHRPESPRLSIRIKGIELPRTLHLQAARSFAVGLAPTNESDGGSGGVVV